MSNIMNFIELLNRINNTNILDLSFHDQGNTNKPCSASFVDKLEKVIITNEDVDNNLSCAICQDCFKLGEKVIKLPCKDPHFFHYKANEEDCGGILPWLKNHNSCPICREEFPEQEPDDIPVPEENFDEVVEENEDSNNDTPDTPLTIEQVFEQVMTRMNRNIEVIPTPIELTPIPREVNYQFIQIHPPNPILFNLMNDSHQLFDPDLDEAIHRSLED